MGTPQFFFFFSPPSSFAQLGQGGSENVKKFELFFFYQREVKDASGPPPSLPDLHG